MRTGIIGLLKRLFMVSGCLLAVSVFAFRAGSEGHPTARGGADPEAGLTRASLLAAARVRDVQVPSAIAGPSGALSPQVHPPWHAHRRGNPQERTLALTFDDGPHPVFTPRLLAILRRYHVKATFFVVGKMAQQHPELVRAEVAAGHLIGNHTFHHVNLTRIPDSEVRNEWLACQLVVKGITGQTMRYDRPPGGDWDASVVREAERLGLTTVLWTDDPGDYASPGDRKIETRVLDRINNGGIILLHDGIQQTLDVLPQIIEHLQSHGYRFVTVDQMRAERVARGPRK